MNNEQPIGGYFELELSKSNRTYHKSSYALNSCRNSLLLIIQTKKYNKIYVPYYTCGVILDTLINNKIEIEYYHINKNFEILDFIENKKNEAILYTNYFGLKDEYIKKVSLEYENLIIDNAQAFFSEPINELDTIYSPRKFFGIPDGGLLITKTKINLKKYQQDISYERCTHLLKRIELKPEEGYNDFIENDKTIDNLPIMRMSKISNLLLSQIDYENVKKTRQENFNFLHKKLHKLNELVIEINQNNVPLIYPLLINGGSELKKTLIKNRIFVATYWLDVIDKVHEESFEHYLTNNLIALPIDQRYSVDELKIMINIILNN